MNEGFNETINNVEDLFKELDQSKFTHVVSLLGALRKELMKEGFTRREAMKLVEAYAKFVYDFAMEDFISERRREEIELMNDIDEEELSDNDSPDEDY